MSPRQYAGARGRRQGEAREIGVASRSASEPATITGVLDRRLYVSDLDAAEQFYAAVPGLELFSRAQRSFCEIVYEILTALTSLRACSIQLRPYIRRDCGPNRLPRP
jgi:hypothetical protein